MDLLIKTLLVLLLKCLFLPWDAQAQVQLFLQGSVVPNNTVLRIEDIGENDDAVICRTDLRPCCASLSNRHGEWYYPDGRLVPNYGAGEDFYRNRGDDGTVRLNRRNNAQQPAGVFRCEVPDRNRRLQKLTLGVVSPDSFPIITEHPREALEVDPGSDVTFSLIAMLGTAYQWKLNGTNLSDNDKYDGSKRSVLTVRNVQESDEGDYQCVVGNRLVSIISERARLTVLNSPSILINPVNVLGVAIGDEVAFVVVAKGNRLSYLWEYGDGSPLPDDPRYDGKETTILTIFNLILEDSGLYRCRISNTAGLVYSQPAQLTVGRILTVESIDVRPEITSALITWTPPSDSDDIEVIFQLMYYPIVFPERDVLVNVTSTSYHAVGLIPSSNYRFQVRLLLSSGPSTWTTANVTLHERIPSVENLRYELKNEVLVVMWDPISVTLPGWNISHYRISYNAHQVNNRKTTIQSKVETVSADQLSYNIQLDDINLNLKFEHVIEVSAGIDTGLEGVEFIEGEISTIVVSLELEKSQFQVVLGPVEHCITWNVDQATKFEFQIREAIRLAISEQCNCSLSPDQISPGIFSCRTNPRIVTFRSSISGLNSTALTFYLEEWVLSQATITLDWFLVDVYSTCSVQIVSLNEPECNPFTTIPQSGTFTFSTNSSVLADCVNECLKSK